MTARYRTEVLTLGLLILLLLSAPAGAQQSIGFSHPDSTANLLDYRLPDWSYRVWDADFDFSGGGYDRSANGGFSNGVTTRILTSFDQAWESDDRQAQLGADLAGDYARQHQGTESSEMKGHDLGAALNLTGSYLRYPGGGEFFAGVEGGLHRQYLEDESSRRTDATWEDENRYSRRATYRGAVRAGWGRLRNVVPVLRAERLSERLVALGRPPLTPAQVRRLADVFSQQFAYRQVFDRSDRHFWEDILTPLLGPARDLTPVEVLYLQDVLNEDLGDRSEGLILELMAIHDEYDFAGSSPSYNSRRRALRARATWSHNRSLLRQWRFSTSVGYSWGYGGGETREYGTLGAAVEHLWLVADRYRWDVAVTYSRNTESRGDRRNGYAGGRTAFHVYLEDRVDLVSSIEAAYDWRRIQEDKDFGWEWTYRIGLTYHLDRAFL